MAAATLLAAGMLTLSTSAAAEGAGTTRIVVEGEVGDHLLNGRRIDVTDVITATHRLETGAYEFVSVSDTTFADVIFRAPDDGSRLEVGSYEHVERADLRRARNPGLYFFGGGLGCSAVSGRFRVDELTYADDGSIATFAARFEQHCDHAVAATFGSVAYHATTAPFTHRVDTASLVFPATAVGSATAPRHVTITNTSTVPLPIDGIDLTGPGADEFGVVTDQCSGVVLPAAAECAVSVDYRPASDGGASAVLAIRDAATWWEGNEPLGSRPAAGQFVLLAGGDAAAVPGGARDPSAPADPAVRETVPAPDPVAVTAVPGGTAGPTAGADPSVPPAAVEPPTAPSAASAAGAPTSAGAPGTTAASQAPRAAPIDDATAAASVPAGATATAPSTPTHRSPGRSSLPAAALIVAILAAVFFARRPRAWRRSAARPAPAMAHGEAGAARPTTRTAVAARTTAVEPATCDLPPIAFRLFGGPTFVTLPAPSPTGRELVSRLALDPAGATAGELALTLGFGDLPASDAHRKTVAALSRVRSQLGTTAAGEPIVSRAGRDGRYRLDGAFTTDLAQFLELTRRARGVTATEALAWWLAAFALLDGEAFATVAPPWLVTERWATRLDDLVRRNLDLAHDAAVECRDRQAIAALAAHAERIAPQLSWHRHDVAPVTASIDAPTIHHEESRREPASLAQTNDGRHGRRAGFAPRRRATGNGRH